MEKVKHEQETTETAGLQITEAYRDLFREVQSRREQDSKDGLDERLGWRESEVTTFL